MGRHSHPEFEPVLVGVGAGGEGVPVEGVGVGRTTVANWETGHSDPTPPGRLPYLKLLKGLAEIYPAAPAPAAAAATWARDRFAALRSAGARPGAGWRRSAAPVRGTLPR